MQMNVVNSTKKQTTNFLSANFQNMSKLFHIEDLNTRRQTV